MGIRMRRAETDRLELSDGDFLIVKRDLTAGEYRAMMRESTGPIVVTGASVPNMELDPTAAGFATVLAYLLDWSFTDADGRKVIIADQPPDVVRSVLDNIDSASYMEVQTAIQAHQKARADALAEEKKTRSGVSAPDKTLTSVA